jgi:hypothetical protein
MSDVYRKFLLLLSFACCVLASPTQAQAQARNWLFGS